MVEHPPWHSSELSANAAVRTPWLGVRHTQAPLLVSCYDQGLYM
jgi:hypothetical protein